MKTKQKPVLDPDRDRIAEAIAWFADLMHHRYIKRHVRANEARTELSRLGVEVEFRTPRPAKKTTGQSQTRQPLGSILRSYSSIRPDRQKRQMVNPASSGRHHA